MAQYGDGTPAVAGDLVKGKLNDTPGDVLGILVAIDPRRPEENAVVAHIQVMLPDQVRTTDNAIYVAVLCPVEGQPPMLLYLRVGRASTAHLQKQEQSQVPIRVNGKVITVAHRISGAELKDLAGLPPSARVTRHIEGSDDREVGHGTVLEVRPGYTFTVAKGE